MSFRDTKSQNFPVGRISCPKTFRTECVNRFRDINAPKVRKFSFVTYMRQKCVNPHCQENFHTIWKLSRPSVHFPDCLETFWTVWKLSEPSFQNFPRLSTLSGNFSDCPELSALSGNFPHCLETFQTVWKLSRLS